ncbi:MAG: Tad domain-containing protein, partial [Actinobacteria bacterium]|nr:Tad domain-containing protein [Actinomycetota bacterium]
MDRSRAHDDGDRGFILVTFGLLLIPIMVFTALAVDVSSWYSRATELQRSADAAALAGVVWMPNFSKSTTDANTVLAKNGFTNGGNIATSTSVGTQSANAFQVCVSDNKVRQFFGMVFASPTKMTRCATAMYNTPLQLGSPLNYFGGNNSSLMQYVPGPVPPGAYVDAPAAAAFGSDKYCWVRSGATTVGFWDRTSSGNWAPDQWRFWT